jgi:hypothetical protein
LNDKGDDDDEEENTCNISSSSIPGKMKKTKEDPFQQAIVGYLSSKSSKSGPTQPRGTLGESSCSECF